MSAQPPTSLHAPHSANVVGSPSRHQRSSSPQIVIHPAEGLEPPLEEQEDAAMQSSYRPHSQSVIHKGQHGHGAIHHPHHHSVSEAPPFSALPHQTSTAHHQIMPPGAAHGKMVHPHEVSLSDDWSGPNPRQQRSGSIGAKTRESDHSANVISEPRSTSVGSKSQTSEHSTGLVLFATYPSTRSLSGPKQVAFLAIQPCDVHEVHVQNAAGAIKPDAIGTKRRGEQPATVATSCIYEKHPRLINSIYRSDLSLKYELLVPPKKATRNLVNVLSRLFARASGVITHGSRSDAERLAHLPEVVVVQNEHVISPNRMPTSSVHEVTNPPDILSPMEPRSRLGTNGSQNDQEKDPVGSLGLHDTSSIGIASSRFRMKMSESFANTDTPPPTDNPIGSIGTGMRLSVAGADQISLASKTKMSLRSRINSLAFGGVGFFLQALPPTSGKPSPTPKTEVAVDRPDSPHIETPTRTGGSVSSCELDASTPDRYQENASALYLMQPVSVNTFRRLRPTEAMSIRYIDRTSSLSLCVSGTDHSADLDERGTLDDDLEEGRGSRRSSSTGTGSQSAYGDYGATSLIPTHKRALVYQGGEWLINNPDRTVYTLLYTKHTKVGMKDYAVDFRAQMDATRLLRDAVVELDSHDSHIYKIIQRLVSRIVDNDFEATGRGNDAMRKARCKDEALKRLFVDKSVTVLARAIQGSSLSEMLDDTLDIQMASDQIWICAFAQLHDISGRHVAFCRTSGPVNIGHISEELKFVVLVMTPTVEKSTKTALETARTFATLFLDVETRNQLSGALDEQEFRDVLMDHANRLHAIQEHPELVRRLTQKRASRVYFKSRCLSWYPGQGIYLDVKRRWPHYKSDYTDGIRGPNTVHKLLSTIVFLYFAVLLPTLAFGVLNDSNTSGKIGVQKHIFAQVFGGLMFGIFGGQPLLVIMTTAPLGLYMRILYSIANQFQVDFFAFYSCIGLWNCFFLCIYALMNTSCLTNLCTRTIQDIFEMFALFAFVVDGFTELMHNFGEHYFSDACQAGMDGHLTGVWALTGNVRGVAPPGASPSTLSTQPQMMSTTTEATLNETSPSSVFQFLSFFMGSIAKRSVDAFMGVSAENDTLANATITVGPSTIFEDFFEPNTSTTTSTTSTSTTTMAASTIVRLFEEVLADANTTTSSTLSPSTFTTALLSNATTSPNPFYTAVSQFPDDHHGECRRDRALLYLLLMLATWWSSLKLHSFAKTPYLNKKVREFLADYSLPIAIIAVSMLGRLVFGDVQLEQFTIYDYSPTRAKFEELPLWCIFVCGGIGFIISLLFFFDTTITNSVVCRPTNKLKKGTTYDYDLLIVALINGTLSLFALPWLYPTTPQSPLHLLGLADVEERVDAGHVYQAVVRVRETRLTTIVASIMIGLSLFMLPYPLAYISRPVLNGLFLYMAAMSIHDNQLMERIMLLFTEQTAYPPHHYIRTVPQRQLHLITVIQIVQLMVICGMGLYGRNIYVEMLFPIVLCLMFPVRHTLMPKIIDIKYLESLEGLKSSTMSKRAVPAFNTEM